MNIQFIIAVTIIGVAVVFVGRNLWSKRRSFSVKPSCNDDCGCNGGGK